MSKNLKHWYDVEDEEEFDEQLPKIQRIKRKNKYSDEPKQKDETQK